MGHIFVIYDILAVGAVWVIAGMDDGRRSGRGVAALQSTLTLQTVDKYICHLQKYICHLQKYILQWKTIRKVKHNYSSLRLVVDWMEELFVWLLLVENEWPQM